MSSDGPSIAKLGAGIDPSSYCVPAPPADLSPIDAYYDFSEHVLKLGDPTNLAASPTLGRLLLLGLVSGVEAYFRRTLAGVLRICPTAREHAADQTVALGALDYYGRDEAELGLFDRSSLAGSEQIRDWTKKLTGIPIPSGSAVAAALDQFDQICHLRHAAVHSQGTLGSGNVRRIGLSPDQRVVVKLDFAGLQSAGAACHVVVRTYNRWIFEELLTRWNKTNRLARVWTDDRDRFTALYELFRSDRDGSGPADAKNAYRLLPFGVRMRREASSG